jgi:signal transduction histidine kinase
VRSAELEMVLLRLARSVLGDLDVDTVLERVLESARELTGARYAALGVLDPSRAALERFITLGIDERDREAIGPLPTGRGVLGELIRDPVPLRLDDVGSHPRSYGFPIGHPPMRSFLGVPVIVADSPYGNLYLTDKEGGGAFTEEDERALVVLAEFAGIAIDHARRFSGSEIRREELERTVSALDATIQISRAVGGQTELNAVLELVAKRGRALVSARALVIEYRRGDELVVAAGAGELPRGLLGRRLDLRDSVASAAMRTLRTQRLEDEPNRMRFERHGLGQLGVHAAAGLVVPLTFRGTTHGVLVAVDRLDGGPAFTANDQQLLEAFATSAATAVATAESVADERRSQRLAATEQERTRWARELHDETLQGLAALRLGLAAAARAGTPEKLAGAVGQAIEQLESEIAGLRALITDLRPAALDQLGPEAAIEALAARARGQGLDVEVRLDFAYEKERNAERLVDDLETAVYRIVQEALTNARKHGGADRAVVEVHETDEMVSVRVRDDGDGFDPSAATAGFGLVGMQERVELMHGTVEVDSAPGKGTTVTASFPVRRRGRASPAADEPTDGAYSARLKSSDAG